MLAGLWRSVQGQLWVGKADACMFNLAVAHQVEVVTCLCCRHPTPRAPEMSSCVLVTRPSTMPVLWSCGVAHHLVHMVVPLTFMVGLACPVATCCSRLGPA